MLQGRVHGSEEELPIIDNKELANNEDGDCDNQRSPSLSKEQQVNANNKRKRVGKSKVTRQSPPRTRLSWTKVISGSARCREIDLDRAKGALLVASPGSLPCRNKEIDEITRFVMGALAAGSQSLGRSLYIHGMPGTGKTTTVLTVMKKLQAEVDAKVIQPYRFVKINGLKLFQPENIYKLLYEALYGRKVSWKKALQFLNQHFSKSKHDCQPCILLIDELDLLVTRNQSVLYNIFDWPTIAHSQLIVIVGIANTMDLPDKLLPHIGSRMGMQRICFSPYSYLQLKVIISNHLDGLEVLEKQVIEYFARKVAAVSGDARQALELCRHAIECVEFKVQQCFDSQKTAKNDQSVTGDGASKYLVGIADIEGDAQNVSSSSHSDNEEVFKTCQNFSCSDGL